LILKEWELKSSDKVLSPELCAKYHLSPLVADLLAKRGFFEEESLASFLQPADLTDPFTLPDMGAAVERVAKAVEEDNILIFGDYDADGVCSTAILYDYLRALGARVTYCLPTREGEGYGLNNSVVEAAARKGISLILCVDNGISCIEQAALAKQLNLDLVILDHHQPGEVLPDAVAVVDAHRKDATCRAEARGLCGAGVALMFVAAMEGDSETALAQYAHLAAIATIADIVPLTGDNRYIVQYGLGLLKETDHGGICALFEMSGLDRQNLTAENIGFGIAPRINAAGRMGNAADAFRLLMADNPEDAAALAENLCRMNQNRRQIESEIMGQIEEAILHDPTLVAGRVCFFAGAGWNRGVLGIVAARLMGKYGKPVFVADIGTQDCAGSARSFGNFSAFDALSACKNNLTKFGGHRGAGGFSCTPEAISNLRDTLENYAAQQFPIMELPKQPVDGILPPIALSVENVRDLSRLEPCGAENEAPIFGIQNLTLRHIYAVSDGKYVRFDGQSGGASLSFISFFFSFDTFPFEVGDCVDLLFSPSVRAYRGEDSVSCKCLDIRPSGFPYQAYHLGLAVYHRFICGETIKLTEAEKCLPGREDFVMIWKTFSALAERKRTAENLFFRLFPKQIGYGKLLFALKIFCEAGLVHTENDLYVPNPQNGKVDLTATKTYQALQQQIC